MKKLELNCKYLPFSLPYKEETASWVNDNVEFKIKKEEGIIIGYFRVWSDGVEPEMIKDVWKKLEEKAESFALGMKFIGNRKIHRVKTDLFYYLNSDKFTIRKDVDIEAIIRRSKGEEFNYLSINGLRSKICIKEHVNPLPLPKKLPSVPIGMERYILTIIQAEERDGHKENYEYNYEDEQIKRWFIILEELETNNKSSDAYKDIKYARDFVSHSVCHCPKVIAFLKRELPIAVYINPSGREEARFCREDKSHIALVSKYQYKARHWARQLVKQEIEKHGGNVN